jgi:hypothetical protein
MLAFLALLLWASIFSFYFSEDFVRRQPIGAFGAFYCGAVVLRTGADPYRTEPLRSCERKLPGYNAYRIDGAVEPVPLPGYAVAAFMPLSLLSFKAAFLLFSFLSIAATLIAAAALSKVTGFSPFVIGAALLLSDLYRNLSFGEIPPLVIGALALAAWALTKQRHTLAAACFGAALIEPHVALPALIAVGIAVPAMRRPLVVTGAVLFVLWFTVSGAGGMREYFTSVLPLQAQAELPASDQYSLSWLLNFLGFSDRVALTLGSLSYLFFAALGVAVAVGLARRFKEPAYVALFPPVTAMIGGSFMHDIQIAIALPAALLFCARVPFGKLASFTALLALAMPWPNFNKLTLILVPTIAVVLSVSCYEIQSRHRLRVALVGAMAVMLVFYGLQRFDTHRFHPVDRLPRTMQQEGDGETNASAAWARYVRISGYGDSSPRTLAEKIPVWIGLPLLSFAGIGSLLEKSRPWLDKSYQASNNVR